MNDNTFIDLLSDEKMAIAFEENNHLALAKHIGKSRCNFTEEDEKFIDMFWDQVFNSSWIYLSEEIVVGWMGYKKSKNTMNNFYIEMKDKYREGIDYKEVDKNNELVAKFYSCLNKNENDSENKGGNRKKYYIITGNTLKKMLMRTGTKKGDSICDYFIKVESLASMTHQAIFKYLQTKKDKVIQEKDEELNRINVFVDECVTYKKKIRKK